MKRLIAIGLALLVTATLSSGAESDEKTTIPLDQIWAYKMLGTRDISHLIVDDPLAAQRPSSLEYILRKLRSEPPNADAMNAFAFTGPPQTALGKARHALYGRAPLEGDSLPANSDIYIAFFSRSCAYDVRLEKIERQGRVVDIRYRFVPRYAPVPTVNIALIPLGKLPVGEYRVDVNQMPMAQEHVDAGFAPVSEQQARRIVCGPFSFSIIVPPPPDPGPSPDAVMIPLDQIRYGTPGSRQLRDLEPELFIYRDTPEKVAKYSTPEGREELQEIRKRAKEQSLVLAIERAMAALPTGKEAKPGPGFAVKGIDRAVLQDVYDVLVEGKKPVDHFPTGSQVSIVFFTRQTQPGVRLDRVERRGNQVEIHYMLISHGLTSVRWNLALIPLGKLPPGEYRVEMIRSREKEKDFNQRDFPPVETGIEKRIVCQPFSFTVSDPEVD